MILCNGVPKAGNHALVKALELLGQPAEVNHIPFADGLPDGVVHHLFIKRDPRNLVVSRLRHIRETVTPKTFVACFRKFMDCSLVDECTKYEGWLSSAHVVSYESMIADDAEMRDIANFIGVPYIDDAFEELPGATVTWNDVRSDYRTVWTPDVETVWNAEGGPELLHRWGYV